MTLECKSLRIVLFVLATLAAAPAASADGWFSWFGGDGDAPGTAEWWDDHKNDAVFEPGKGYKVAGVDGYFDDAGRPINAPVDEVFEKFSGDEGKHKGLLPGLDPKITYQKAKLAAGYGPNEQAARDSLAEGERLLAQKEYSEAAGQFKKAIDRLPNSAVAHRAKFLLGECYFFQDKYADARDTYDELVHEQPNTRDLDTLIERQWSIAQYWESHFFDYNQSSAITPNFFDKTRPTFDTLGQAVKTYESIRLNDPTGPRADDAIMATAGIYFRRGRYADADYHYSLLRQEYPRSEHQFDAHILGLQSKLRRYQGADYDGSSLEEAQKLVKQIRTQFAGRLTAEEKDRLKQSAAEVQVAIEQRDLRLAQYYDNQEFYGAAKQVYARIARDHQGSPIASQATERLAQLGGVPDVPATRLAWFVDAFPENRERSLAANITEVGAGETRVATNPESPGGVQPASATETR